MIGATLRGAGWLLTGLLLSACVSETVTRTAVPRVHTLEHVEEHQLLDVGVAIFDPGLSDADEEELVYPEVRRAEAHYQPWLLAEAIQSSASWGAVRVVPDQQQISDLLVTGTILNSHGEKLKLHIVARDASGRVWLDREYESVASRYSYSAHVRSYQDPFQSIYNNVANDLLSARQKLRPEQLVEIRSISELRFAQSMSPEAFGENLAVDGKGNYRVQRLPAEEDPMLSRVRRIRERDYLYIDTLQAYYSSYQSQMTAPYQEWRKMTYEEAVALRELRRESLVKMVAGAGMVLAGIAAQDGDARSTRTAGQVGIMGGAMVFKSGLQARSETDIHIQALEELGLSLETAVAPQVIELENRSITLTGNVQDQYRQWQQLLREIYATEVGLPSEPEDAKQVAPDEATAADEQAPAG